MYWVLTFEHSSCMLRIDVNILSVLEKCITNMVQLVCSKIFPKRMPSVLWCFNAIINIAMFWYFQEFVIFRKFVTRQIPWKPSGSHGAPELKTCKIPFYFNRRFTMPQTCHNKVCSYNINDLLCHKHVTIKSGGINDLQCHKPVQIKSVVLSTIYYATVQTCHKSEASCWSLLHSSTIHTVVFRITYAW